MNRNCSVCNIKIDENNYLKDRTVCKSGYNKNRRKNNKNYFDPNSTSKSNYNLDNDKKKRKVLRKITKRKEKLLTL